MDDVQELIAVAAYANIYSFVILLSSSITFLVVRTSPKNKRVFIKVTSRKISSNLLWHLISERLPLNSQFHYYPWYWAYLIADMQVAKGLRIITTWLALECLVFSYDNLMG